MRKKAPTVSEKASPPNHPEISSQKVADFECIFPYDPYGRNRAAILTLFGRRVLGQYPAAPSSPGPFVLLLKNGKKKRKIGRGGFVRGGLTDTEDLFAMFSAATVGVRLQGSQTNIPLQGPDNSNPPPQNRNCVCNNIADIIINNWRKSSKNAVEKIL